MPWAPGSLHHAGPAGELDLDLQWWCSGWPAAWRRWGGLGREGGRGGIFPVSPGTVLSFLLSGNSCLSFICQSGDIAGTGETDRERESM